MINDLEKKCDFNECLSVENFENLIKCNFCEEVFYCSTKCRNLDWQKNHHLLCQCSLKSKNGIINSFSLIPKNYVLKDFDSTTLIDDDQNFNIFIEKSSKKQYLCLKLKIFNSTQLEKLLKEIKLFKWLTHPHILKLQSYFEDSKFIYLLNEPIISTLNLIFQKRKKLIEREAFIFFTQICLGLDYLHKNNIYLGDFNIENIFLDQQNNVKLSYLYDLEEKKNEDKTTKYYAKIDVLNLGAILYYLLHGFYPFKKISSEKQSLLRIASYVSSEASDLLKKMLDTNIDKRIDLKNIFDHQWMKMYEEVHQININNYLYPNKKSIKSIEKSSSFNIKFKKRHNSNFDGKINSITKLQKKISFAEGDYESEENKSDFEFNKLKSIDLLENKSKNNLINKKFINNQKIKNEKSTIPIQEDSRDNGNFWDGLANFFGCGCVINKKSQREL